MADRSDLAVRRLKKWLGDNGHSGAWLANELGVGRSVVWRWLNGDCAPRIDHGARVEQITGGYVTGAMWTVKKGAAPEKAA